MKVFSVHIFSLTKPPSENEIKEMHIINQENIPEVGDLSELEDFRARVNWSENIFVYKYEDVIKAFVLCMREEQDYKSPNYEYIYQTVLINFFMLTELLFKNSLEEKG